MKQWLGILSVISTLIARAATAAPPSRLPLDKTAPTTISTTFQGDARLQAKVTLAVKNQPLGDVLSALGKEVRVPLTASRDTADDKVTVFLDDRPASEVLSRLAHHLHFRWSRTSRGYELLQDGTERQHEAALREADREAEWSELKAWMARLEGLASTPRAQLQERAKELGKLLQDSHLAPDERRRLSTEAKALQEALRPETPPAIALLRSLTPAQVEQLRTGGNLLFSRENGSLSPHVLAMLEKLNVPEDDVAYQDSETRPVWADAQVELMEGWYAEGPPRREDRQTRLLVELIIWREMGGKRQWGPVQWFPLLPSKEQATAVATQTDDPVLLSPIALKISRPGISTARRESSAFTYARGFWRAWPTLGDVAQALHQETGLEVLADSFVRCRVDPKLVSGRQPVVRLLDALAQELDYTWQQEGHLLLLRSCSYYRDRELEVPDRVLRPWQARAARAGAKPLDDLAELAAALDDRQTLGMSMYWGWYLEEPWIAPPSGFAFTFHRWRHQLRFWASLNPAQRQQALSGALVPTEQMSTAQRRAFMTALTDSDASPWDTGAAFLLSRRLLTPAEALSGGFSVKTAVWRLQLFSGEKPGETTQIVARYPSDRPPILSNLPHEYHWSELGTPSGLEIQTFSYYLAGAQKPARTVNVEVLGPRAAQ